MQASEDVGVLLMPPALLATFPRQRDQLGPERRVLAHAIKVQQIRDVAVMNAYLPGFDSADLRVRPAATFLRECCSNLLAVQSCLGAEALASSVASRRRRSVGNLLLPAIWGSFLDADSVPRPWSALQAQDSFAKFVLGSC